MKYTNQRLQKKGADLSINVIIVAVIALVVLVVIVAIFTGRLGMFSTGLDETTDCGQICKARGYGTGMGSDDDKSDGGYTKLIGARDDDGQCWCIK